MMGRLADVARHVSPSARLLGSVYVLVVAVVAAEGFVVESTAVILLAALLSLPASVIALPGYYVAYGLLALVPGANPNESSGSSYCTSGGDCVSSTTGDLADWFQATTEVLGVLAFTCAALINLLALRILTARRRSAGAV